MTTPSRIHTTTYGDGRKLFTSPLPDLTVEATDPEAHWEAVRNMARNVSVLDSDLYAACASRTHVRALARAAVRSEDALTLAENRAGLLQALLDEERRDRNRVAGLHAMVSTENAVLRHIMATAVVQEPDEHAFESIDADVTQIVDIDVIQSWGTA